MTKNKIYDFVVIGSGPAGSVVSWNLANEGFKIAIIDRATNIKKNSDKNSFIFSPYVNECPDYYTPLFSNQLGGNSALWNNKIYLMSEDEFKNGNWPFSYDELIGFSKDLSKKFNLNHDHICKISNDNGIKYSSSLRAKKLGNLFNFLKIYENKNIDVYSSSSPISLNIDKNKFVKSLFIKNLNKKENFEIIFNKSIIFCAGGLGNPNILQNLLKDYNQLIGKKLSDHPHINLGALKVKEAKNSFRFSKYFINKSEENIEQNLYYKIDSYFVGVQLDFISDPARYLKRAFVRARFLLPKLVISILIKYYSFFFKLVIAILSILNLKGKYSYEFFFSQNQSLDNMININRQTKDDYGLCKSDIIFSFTSEDKGKYKTFIEYLIGKKGILFQNDKIFNFETKKILTGLHPSCTTSIGHNESEGPVDKNLKLIGYKNIFVCGSSIFKNNGFTNPTWTIMTLSNRLSSFLSKND